MVVPQFSTLKCKSLTKCFETLALINFSDLKDEDFIELKKLMVAVVSKTQSFLRNINIDDYSLANSMKHNCEIFIKEMEKCQDIVPYLKKLQSLWTKFSRIELGIQTKENETRKDEKTPTLDLLRTSRLSKCFELLAEIKVFDLTSEQKMEFENILYDIMLRTHSFMGIMTSNDFYKAKKMKKNYDIFVDNIQKCEISLHFPRGEFKNAWKTLEMFDPTSKDPTLETMREKKIIVDEVVETFNERPNELFQNTEKEDFDPLKEIEDVLAASKLNEHLLPYMPSFICRTITIINQNSNSQAKLWKKKVFIIDDNRYPYVVYHNGEYFVDAYGNVYLNEMHFLQTSKRFFDVFSFESSEGEVYDIELLEDKTYLEMFLSVLQRFNEQSKAYSQFLSEHGDNTEEMIEILKKLKFHFNFFYDMHEWLMENSTNCFNISLKNHNYKVTFVISANNRNYPGANDWLMKNYYHFFNSIDANYNHTIDYHKTVEHIMTYFNTIPTELFFYVYDRHIKKLEKKFNESIINIFHFIVADIITFLLSRRVIKYTLKPVELKYILLWVIEKYGGLHTNKEMLMKHYNDYKENIGEEYCILIEATKHCEKSVIFRFSNIYAATYHFGKNYNCIRSSLEKHADTDEFKKELKALPPKIAQDIDGDLIPCASFYFKTLPDTLITEDNSVTIKVDPVERHAVKSLRRYRKYSIEIVECILDEKYSKQGYNTFIGSIFAFEKNNECSAKDDGDSDSLISEYDNDFDTRCSGNYYTSLTVLPKSSRMMAH